LHDRLLLLAFLAADEFAHLADAFALVGLGGTPAADFGRDLTNGLLVSAGDLDLGGFGRSERDAGGAL
jgi:hypothetical protein